MHINYFNIFGISFLVGCIGIVTVFQIKYNFLNEQEIYLQYDFIIVGGGTAGCVVAGQLATKTNYSILLIEAGDKFNVFAKIPLAAPLFQRSKYDWSFKTEPQTRSSFGFFNQSQMFPRGKGLGGSGQLNYLVHMEPSATDYEIWRTIYNITNWNYSSLYPHFRKMLCDDDEFCQKNKDHPYIYLSDNYLEGSELVEIFENGLKELQHISILPTKSTILNGKRWTTYDGYLKPVLKLKNLHILLNTQVKKIIFSRQRAIGVETDSIKTPKIYIRKEIILSAGAIQTPKLLLLSGIGPKHDLEKLNIPVVANVDGVGKNLHDHFSSLLYVSVNKSISTTIDKVQSVSEIWNYITNNKGLLSYLPIMSIGRTVDDITLVLFAMGSTDETAFRGMANFKSETFRKLFPLYYNTSQEGFVLLSSCLQPKSRGQIKLRDADYKTPPIVDPNYLDNPDDLQCMIKALKISKAIVDTNALKKLDAKIHWPQFEQCLKWKNDVLNDHYLECIIRISATTGYHPSGTCRMGNTNDCVVNEQLRVRGIRGVRIIDSSVLPSPVTHFPNSLLIAVANQAVSLILNKH